MKLENRLAGLPDDMLLQRLADLAHRHHALTAALLAHIAEVDRRRLYLREACPSMHAYCVERLGLSDGAAYKRIHAARAARRFPQIFEMVERGELHLKGITLLAPHLRESNVRGVLERAQRQPVRAIEKLVAELCPKPDVASRVRTIPSRQRPESLPTEAPSVGKSTPTPDRPAAHKAPAPSDRVTPLPHVASAEPPSPPAGPHPEPAPAPAPARRNNTQITPLSPRRYELRITIDEAALADLEQLQDLLAHQVPYRDPAAIVSRALALLLERTAARKAAVTDRPRPDSHPAAEAGQRPKRPRSRHIPAQVRRTVWTRDGGRCAFRDAAGRRCTCTSTLEFHHVDNWARGADHDPDRLELRCRAHNQYQAVLDYGEDFMERAGAANRNRSGAREPVASYGRTRAAGEPRTHGPAGPL